MRSGRVLARGSKAIAAGTSTYRLKLPRKAKAGRYVLKVTFTPQGGTASTSTRKVTLAGKAKQGRPGERLRRPRAARLRRRRAGRAAGRQVPRRPQAQLRAARPLVG